LLEYVEQVEALRSRIQAEGLGVEVYDALEALEAEIAVAGGRMLTEAQHFDIVEVVDAQLSRDSWPRASKLARENRRALLTQRLTLELLEIPSPAGCFA
jgi:hypothetical protein